VVPPLLNLLWIYSVTYIFFFCYRDACIQAPPPYSSSFDIILSTFIQRLGLLSPLLVPPPSPITFPILLFLTNPKCPFLSPSLYLPGGLKSPSFIPSAYLVQGRSAMSFSPIFPASLNETFLAPRVRVCPRLSCFHSIFLLLVPKVHFTPKGFFVALSDSYKIAPHTSKFHFLFINSSSRSHFF